MEIRIGRLQLHHIPFPNNMGMVRYILAFAVVFAHFNSLTGNKVYFPVSSYEAVGGFFALSGFLMYASYHRRPDMKGYVKARARRLLPAYCLIVVLAAFALASLSTLSLGEYFTSRGFWKYLFANITFMNFLEPTLPGVFGNCVIPAVNGSLWTMKVEWALYLSVPLFFFLLRRFGGRPVIWFSGIVVFAICYRLFFTYLYSLTENGLYQILGRQFLGQMSYFYIGALCYHLLPTFIRYKWYLLIVVVLLFSLSLFLPDFHYAIIVQPFAVSIAAIWFSIIGKWGTWEGKHDNISYNIYLCHFPVIQSYVTLSQGYNITSCIAFLTCCVATIGLAYILLLGEKGIRKLIR
ncbi:MAG: acyltransferase [Bacteroides sp.]|nr:acyltransferase [Bacteroides sp.]